MKGLTFHHDVTRRGRRDAQQTLLCISVKSRPRVQGIYAGSDGEPRFSSHNCSTLYHSECRGTETFILNPGSPAVPVELHHLGLWFADPTQAGNAGCPATVTPFDGDHNAGIQVLNTSNFVDAKGPLGGIQ
jgi:hypothetical protein